ncbi:hypothetical protein EOA37_09590 [Mesorhizobium sp. M2A.F.Ca.ET.015.02.1.1]|uniref:hypothetical protein n=1 Tax=Mesorhizobium sp. M2A.F.Ca.ET.015.02.1.1 TaxID=2496758 RepID=UPI000FCC3462|nr:hypothetical protein [Mesorhizobium sp. M2A.F.Ca.ET.015.02.1.1]RUW41504.1 hypothetical protein EOA37_09590 [Mesorhizobium sp. M2A.F.Ca.ET.015.02.1.1]
MGYLKLFAGLVIALIIAGAIAAAAIYRGNAISAQAEAKQAKADLATEKAVNDANQATIGRMRAQAEADARMTAELAQQLADANQVFIDNTAALAKLKDANADVSHFLSTPVPADLRRLYDKPGAAGGRQN